MLEISHLVVNGCSFTYCQGLEDPTTQGWPALLAKKLNVPVVNLGIKGSGNDSIYRRTAEYFYLNKKNNSKPFYIIAFTEALRREEFLITYQNKIINDAKTLACYGNEQIEKSIYEHMDNNGVYYMEKRKLLHWLSIINMFKANNTQYFTTNYMHEHAESFNKLQNKYTTMWDEVHNDPCRLEYFYNLTKGLDTTECGHDGPKSQEVVAEYCYFKMLEKYQKIAPINANFLNLKTYVETSDKSINHIIWENNLWYKKEINYV